MSLDDLPYLTDAQRRRRPNAKPRSRLEEKVALQRDTSRLDIGFRLAVWRRDQGRCRVCGVKVKRTLELDPVRGEVHHIARREDQAVRYDPRNGVLVCATDHRQFKARTLHVVGTAKDTFIVAGKTYLNADRPLRFVRRR
jgi:5-methylcytosine-specific restriction endonuclease McrA